jgi:hypothetical protein
VGVLEGITTTGMKDRQNRAKGKRGANQDKNNDDDDHAIENQQGNCI